jgi:hypothetical protein
MGNAIAGGDVYGAILATIPRAVRSNAVAKVEHSKML